MIKYESGIWKEIIEGRAKAVKVERDITVLMPIAKSRAVASQDLLVQFGMNGEVESWECH
jgi:hypothetical protein